MRGQLRGRLAPGDAPPGHAPQVPGAVEDLLPGPQGLADAGASPPSAASPGLPAQDGAHDRRDGQDGASHDDDRRRQAALVVVLGVVALGVLVVGGQLGRVLVGQWGLEDVGLGVGDLLGGLLLGNLVTVRCDVEGHPAQVLEGDLHPGLDVLAGDGLGIAVGGRVEAHDDAGRDVERAAHEHHEHRVLLVVADEGVGLHHRGDAGGPVTRLGGALGAVGVVARAQALLKRPDLGDGVGLRADDLLGQGGHRRRHLIDRAQ